MHFKVHSLRSLFYTTEQKQIWRRGQRRIAFFQMNGYLPFLTLFIGWLLGLIGPVVQDKIKNHYKTRRVLESIKLELSDLRLELVQITTLLEFATGKITKEKLLWAKPYAKTRIQTDLPINLHQIISSLEQSDDEDFAKAASLMAEQMKNGLYLRTLALPYTQLKVVDLELISENGRRNILEIFTRIRIFNQVADDSKSFIKLTFDPKITPEFKSRIQEQLAKTNVAASAQTRRAVELIGHVLAEFSNEVTEETL